MTTDLLAILDLGNGDDDFLDGLRRFAEIRGARLRLCVTAPIGTLEYSLALESGISLAGDLEDAARDRASRIVAILKGDGIDADVAGLHGELPQVMRRITHMAQTADIALIGPVGAYDSASLRIHAAQALALGSGRPVMLMPRRGVADRIGHLVVGWNGGREAVRALYDALPLLQSDARIDMVSIGETGTVNMAAICRHLGRIGHEATPHELAGTGDAGRLLIDFCREHGGDLLATGAYGHARITEFVLGGVTRTLLHDDRVPILLSH